MHLLHIQYMYISIQYTCFSVQCIYLFQVEKQCKRLTSPVFGAVYSDMSVVVLLRKHFTSWLSTSVILSALSQTLCLLIWANLTLWPMLTIHWPFSIWLIMTNFSSVQIVFHWFFTWIAPDYLYFLLILVTKSNPVEQETTSAAWLYH